jgi:hypothetical protein
MQPPKCANSYPGPDGKPGVCKSNKPAGMTLVVAIEDGNDIAGTRTEARGLYCQDCALGIYSSAVRAVSAQGRATR